VEWLKMKTLSSSPVLQKKKKINIQYPVVFLFTNRHQLRNTLEENISFIIETKNINYLGINFFKYTVLVQNKL
jgi:hypothetical protein